MLLYIVLSSFLCPPPRALAPRAAGHNGADPGPFIRLRFYLSPFQVSTRTPARRTDPPCAAARRRRPPFVFVISSVASFQCPLPTKGVGSAKVATFSRSAKSPSGLFGVGNRRSPFAVAKVLPFFPFHQIFSQLFSKNFCTFLPIPYPTATYAAKNFLRFYALKHAPAPKPQKTDKIRKHTLTS